VPKCTKFKSFPGQSPGAHWGSLQHSPDSLAGGVTAPSPALGPFRPRGSALWASHSAYPHYITQCCLWRW